MNENSTSARGRRRIRRLAVITSVLLIFGLSGLEAQASPGQSVSDLNGSDTPTDLAQSLVGEGITVSNVVYTGHNNSAGRFGGMAAPVGFDAGIVLSSGSVTDDEEDAFESGVLGPNESDQITGIMGTDGDADLETLIAEGTNDAAVLEFDFVPDSDNITFNYVFASDEYLEFVNLFNDVFGFFVNDTNCATVGGSPVSVDNINTTVNPSLYRNNDPNQPGPPTIDTEMDGLTTVLTCNAAVDAGETNHLKLAIADALDSQLDSVVFIQAGSFQANEPPVANDDEYNGSVDTPIQIADPGVLTNDSDADGDSLTAQLGTGPANGTLALDADGGFIYTPNAGFSGSDSFTYFAHDGATLSLTPATVTLNLGGGPSLVRGQVVGPVNITGTLVHAVKSTDVWLPTATTTVVVSGSNPKDGTYEFAGLSPGTYTLYFQPPAESGLGARFLGGSLTREGGVTFTVTGAGGEIVVDTETLELAVGAISGRVTDGSDTGVGGVRVKAFKVGVQWLPVGDVMTAADGTYIIVDLEDADYVVRFEPSSGSGFSQQWYDGAPARATATPVAVAGSEVTGIDAVLQS